MNALSFGDTVHLVASGRLGFAISNDHDCNVYVVSEGSDAVVVDAGCGIDIESVVARIAALSLPPVSRVLVTHAHADHAAGAGVLAARLGAEVWASAVVADILEAGDAGRAGLDVAQEAGLYPASLQYPATRVDRRLGPESFEVGGLRIQVIETPGHAVGHLSFMVDSGSRRHLFSGDLVFSRGRIAISGLPETDIGALGASIEALAELQPDALFAGHAEPTLCHAGEHIAIAARAFGIGVLPPALS